MTTTTENNAYFSDESANNLEVYLFYQTVGKTDKKGNFDEFFAKMEKLDEQLSNSIVFLEPESVWQYSRFMDAGHTVLKAYLPQAAIEGRTHGLTLKKGFVTKSHIHGCFPGWAKGLIYVKNPYFNEDFEQTESLQNCEKIAENNSVDKYR